MRSAHAQTRIGPNASGPAADCAGTAHGVVVGSIPLIVAAKAKKPNHRDQSATDRTSPAPTATGALREVCIVAAQQVIAERGLENLSMREVARKLGVSHQAPYKHYASRDHLLAEVMRRCFQRFANHLDAREHCDAPEEDLAALGRQYLSYAQENPLEYRLMFSTPWPEPAEHPDLVRDAIHTFDILRQVLGRLYGTSPVKRDQLDLDALFVWSSMHGLAGVMNGDVITKLDLKSGLLGQATGHVMQMVGQALHTRSDDHALAAARRRPPPRKRG